eukprot:7381413-Prymnesium_polylepis.1
MRAVYSAVSRIAGARSLVGPRPLGCRLAIARLRLLAQAEESPSSSMGIGFKRHQSLSAP